MECRIEWKREASRKVVSIAGRLSGAAVEELTGVRRSIEGRVTLDLSSLVAADDEGIEAIQTMLLGGDEIQGASPLLQLLLQDDRRG